MNNEKLYTSVDFASYHAGTMSVHGMHALEKAALEDPFLSDALDGYLHTDTAAADILKLKKEFNFKSTDNNVATVWTKKTWWKIAASIVMVFGMGYLFNSINRKENITPLAKNEVVADSIEVIKEDTISLEKNSNIVMTPSTGNTITNIELSPKIKTTITENISPSTPQNTTSANDVASAPATTEGSKIAPQIENKDASLKTEPAPQSLSKEAKADGVVSNKEMENNISKITPNAPIAAKEAATQNTQNTQSQNRLSNNQYNYSGVITSPSGGPMQNATIQLKNTNIATQTDNMGRFNFTYADSIASVSIAAAGYNKRELRLTSNNNQASNINYDGNKFDDGVANGYAIQKSKQQVNVGATKPYLNDGLAGKVAGLEVDKNNAFKKNVNLANQINSDSIMYRKALPLFDAYTRKNIQVELDEKDNAYKGNVILSFSVNKNGRPKKIKVIQGLSKKCDNQAKQLLESGPAWPIFKEKQIVTIVF
jgi:CarboxypepD_reg-like domain/Gram-negative bacterial TonB protein C-terminal